MCVFIFGIDYFIIPVRKSNHRLMDVDVEVGEVGVSRKYCHHRIVNLTRMTTIFVACATKSLLLAALIEHAPNASETHTFVVPKTSSSGHASIVMDIGSN